MIFALFLVFLACDGPLPGYYSMSGPPAGEDILLRGYVLRVVEGNVEELEDAVFEPIKGIAVHVEGGTGSYVNLTKANGEFSFYVPSQEEYVIVFTDIDGVTDSDDVVQKKYPESPALPLTKEEVEKSSKKPFVIPF